jgi:uncharacterized membrane protein
MSRRFTTAPLNKLYSALPYLMPMAGVSFFGILLFGRFPILSQIYTPFIFLARILGHSLIDSQLLAINITIDFILFFVLFIFVVRNYKVPHFIRFHTMQALMLGLGLSLLTALISLAIAVRLFNGLFQLILSNPFLFSLLEFLAATIFIGIIAACGYSVYKVARGEYTDIPIISDAANYHSRG